MHQRGIIGSLEGRRLRKQRLLGLASLGGCGPTVPTLRGPLTRGYSKGAPLGSVVGTEVLGLWCSHFLRRAVNWAGLRATESGGWHPEAPRSGQLVLEPLVRPAAHMLRGPTA